jgi:hypothetical protein
MRNSKAKQLRRKLRAANIGVSTTKYIQKKGTERLKPIKDVEGKVVSTYATVTIMLSPDCGRSIYQSIKTQMKRNLR